VSTHGFYCERRTRKSEKEVQELKDATKELVSKYCRDMPISVFSAREKDDCEKVLEDRDNYFLDSADKIRGFYEEGAVVDGKVIIEEREKALNKIGHALHKYEDAFRQVSFSAKVKEVIERLTTMKRPTIMQSMVIFKQPKVGGKVKPHQDASYLYCEPTSGSLLGFWIALDEANLENGCLYFAPASHQAEKVYQRFIRNPDREAQQLFTYTGDNIPEIPTEKLVPAPAKPGDLVLIDGLVIHQSESNTSEKRRLAYTFHVIDRSATYAPDNWLQPTDAGTFVEF
jgi:ectoine hydroxylase-related dioxygenase (phytanoyl-CoA dioxygenase family)